ncbi:hypothetical protein IW261DRAFT_1020045 [Armillaria novae-zelandiae]|uniref:Secreted protein n=1 Tax=Armillaria novae-zelandiae TaxID=153914 RepID=A0AA39NMZ7_9AGAR|nr:hypothetical protein IW261DRAFT_1020045 [Armillaria novae-zelandiae]
MSLTLVFLHTVWALGCGRGRYLRLRVRPRNELLVSGPSHILRLGWLRYGTTTMMHLGSGQPVGLAERRHPGYAKPNGSIPDFVLLC